MAARTWRVWSPGAEFGGFIPPSKATTAEEAVAEFRAMVPRADCYILRVRRLGDGIDQYTEFPAVKQVAA
jgi:hypothetical protein